MEPSPQLHQHHALEAPSIDSRTFRPWWRIRTRLDGLLLEGAIPPATWRAAVAFRTAAEIVLADIWRSQWAAERQPAGPSDTLGHRVDAANYRRAVHAALGGWAFRLLELHLVDDPSWAEIGRWLGVDPKTAKRWTIAALAALAALGEETPRHRGNPEGNGAAPAGDPGGTGSRIR